MKKAHLSKGLALTLCAVLLLPLCGCDEGGDKPIATTTTTQATAATTHSTTTATEATTTEAAATTTTTITTAAPTTQAPVATDLQIGSSTFTLDGVTFEMGTSPEKLLAHLGQPNEVKDEPDAADGNINHFYYYDDIIVVTAIPAGKTEIAIMTVYFPTNRYSFDGVSVGMSAEEVNAKLSSKLKLQKERHFVSTLYGGSAYSYTGSNTRWFIIFPQADELYVNGEVNIEWNSVVKCIKIIYSNR